MAESRSSKVIILTLGEGLSKLTLLVIFVVLARLFTEEDYATYRQTILAFQFGAPFVMLGLDKSLYYFLPREDKRIGGVLVENQILLGGGGLLMCVFLLAGGNVLFARWFNNPDLASTLLVLAPYPLLMLPGASLNACLLARNRSTQVAVFNATSQIFLAIAVLLPCLIWPNLMLAVGALVAATLLNKFIAVCLMFRACRGGEWRPQWSGMRQQLAFGMPLGFAVLLGTLYRSIDKVLVAALCAPAAFAVYVNGAMELPLIVILTGSITSVLMVEFTVLYAEKKLDQIVALIHWALLKCAAVLIPIMVFLLCMAPELMRLVFGVDYEASAGPFRVYLLLLPMRTVYFSSILLATGKSHHILIQCILCLTSNVIFTSYAIVAFGPIGAAWVTVATSYLVELPYLTWQLCRILDRPIRLLIPWRRYLILIGAAWIGAVLIIAPKYWLAAWPDVVVLAIAGVLYTSVTLMIFDRLGFVSIRNLRTRFQAVFVSRFGR